MKNWFVGPVLNNQLLFSVQTHTLGHHRAFCSLDGKTHRKLPPEYYFCRQQLNYISTEGQSHSCNIIKMLVLEPLSTSDRLASALIKESVNLVSFT